MYVVSIDPGPHCGVALFKQGSLIAVDVLLDIDSLVTYVSALHPATQAVCESFTYGGDRLTGDGMKTIELIGQIKLLCHMYLQQEVLMQRPQCRLPFLVKENPINAWYILAAFDATKRWSDHHRDSVAHGLYFLQREFPDDAA